MEKISCPFLWIIRGPAIYVKIKYRIFFVCTMFLLLSHGISGAQDMEKKEGDADPGYGLLKEVFRGTIFHVIDPHGYYLDTALYWNGSPSQGFGKKVKDSHGNFLKDKAGDTGHEVSQGPAVHTGERGNSLNMGYGIFIPISEYGKRYKNSMVYSIQADFENHNFLGMAPGLAVKSYSLSSREREGVVSSSFHFFQLSAGIIYTINTGLLMQGRRVTAYVRLTEGITRISFHYTGGRDRIVEYVHTMDISWGILIPAFRNILLGAGTGYAYISTLHSPLQSLALSFTAGLRM